jgi:hypothetical protein
MLTKMEPKMDSRREKLMAIMKADKENIEAMRMACLEMTKAGLEVRCQPHWR